MPRNSSGVFTLASAAFIPGTTISSAAVNADFADIATALTQSLATTGVSPMTGVLKAVDGTAGAPGYTFASDVTTGIYRSAGPTVSLAAGGSQGLSVTSTTVTIQATLVTSNLLSVSNGITFNGGPFTFNGGTASLFQQGLGSGVTFGINVNNGPIVITSGRKGQIGPIPYPMTIISWSVVAEQSGSIVFDVLRTNNGVPNSSIVGGGNTPTLSAAQFATANVAGWTSVALATNDFLDFSVTGSPTSIQQCTVSLKCQRTG